jgi:hypothetical protein
MFSRKYNPKKKPYKEPVFLFTSGSLRFAAWAGWYSAFGDENNAEKWCHQANTEWVKEISFGRHFSFLGRYNHDMQSRIKPEKFEELLDDFLKKIKVELKKDKKKNKA